jgi:hypothetical protein
MDQRAQGLQHVLPDLVEVRGSLNRRRHLHGHEETSSHTKERLHSQSVHDECGLSTMTDVGVDGVMFVAIHPIIGSMSVVLAGLPVYC